MTESRRVRRALRMVAAALAVAGLVTACAPPAELHLSGDLRAHDPALAAGADDEPWFV